MECIALLTVSMPVMLLNAVVDVFIAEVYCTASAYPNATNAPRQSVDLQKQVATRPTVPGPKIAHLGPARTLVRYLNSISVRIKSTSAPLHTQAPTLRSIPSELSIPSAEKTYSLRRAIGRGCRPLHRVVIGICHLQLANASCRGPPSHPRATWSDTFVAEGYAVDCLHAMELLGDLSR